MSYFIKFMTKSKFTTMIIKFVIIIIIIIIIVVYITSIQHRKSPLDVARAYSVWCNTQGVIEILEAHEKKPEGQTK